MQATLAAATRQTRGKNEARRLRCAGRLPAVAYGGSPVESLALDVDPKALLRILYSESGINTLVDLAVDGGESGKVLIKEIQHDPVTDALLHVDFFRLAMDRVVTVTVPVTLSGEAAGVKQQGGLLDFVTREFQVECMPTEIPEHVDIDVSDLTIGDGVRVRDVAEGAGWTPVSDLDMLLVHVTAAKTGSDDDEKEESEAAAEGAEGDTDGGGGAT
jgi:large subunit ribosomal protein L25